MEHTKLKYPEIRNNLKEYTRDLANVDIGELWGGGEQGGNSSENIEYILHFFFDDTSFADDPSGYVGLALVDEDEARAVKQLVVSLNTLFDRYGTDLTDMEYVGKPEWDNVTMRARCLLDMLETWKASD